MKGSTQGWRCWRACVLAMCEHLQQARLTLVTAHQSYRWSSERKRPQRGGATAAARDRPAIEASASEQNTPYTSVQPAKQVFDGRHAPGGSGACGYPVWFQNPADELCGLSIIELKHPAKSFARSNLAIWVVGSRICIDYAVVQALVIALRVVMFYIFTDRMPQVILTQ